MRNVVIKRGEKAVKDTSHHKRLDVNGGASFVLDRTFSTFSAKKRLNVSTSIAVLAETRPCPSTASTDLHRSLGSDRLVSSLLYQNSEFFRCCRLVAADIYMYVAAHTKPPWQRQLGNGGGRPVGSEVGGPAADDDSGRAFESTSQSFRLATLAIEPRVRRALSTKKLSHR